MTVVSRTAVSTTDTSSLQPDDLIAPRTDADVRDRRLHELAQPVQIALRASRQILDAARARGIALPTLHPLVARHHVLLGHEIRGKLRVQLPLVLVADTDGDALE